MAAREGRVHPGQIAICSPKCVPAEKVVVETTLTELDELKVSRLWATWSCQIAEAEVLP